MITAISDKEEGSKLNGWKGYLFEEAVGKTGGLGFDSSLRTVNRMVRILVQE